MMAEEVKVENSEEMARKTEENLPHSEDKNESAVKEVSSDGKRTTGANGVGIDIEKKILRQMEYYFGDYNLPKDKFLQEEIKKDDGWVLLKTMLTFKRLAGLSADSEAIVSALKNSEVVEVSEDGEKVRRIPNLPIPELNDERRKELLTRTAYVKGFPKDENIDGLLAFFERVRPENPPENVRMRTYLDKITKKNLFKGSVFVTFKNIGECKEFLESGPYKWNDKDQENLILKWQHDYVDEKRREYKETKSAAKAAVEASREDDKGFELPECSILRAAGFSGDVLREDIKSKLEEFGGEIAYIDFRKGDAEGWIRYRGDSTASDVLEKLTDKSVEVAGQKIVCEVLEGEEKNKYLEKVKDEMRKHKKVFQNKKFKGNKGSKGKNKGQKRKGAPAPENSENAHCKKVK